MQVCILEEHGYETALFGLGLSYGKTSGIPFRGFANREDDKIHALYKRAKKLAPLDGGHNKFLRALSITLDITAPLYWWKQFDTYKIGTVAQSESTMHTLMRQHFTAQHFEGGMPSMLVLGLNILRRCGAFDVLNKILPQAFLQRRIVHTNYAVLRNIIKQRSNHKLSEWHMFCSEALKQCRHRVFLA